MARTARFERVYVGSNPTTWFQVSNSLVEHAGEICSSLGLGRVGAFSHKEGQAGSTPVRATSFPCCLGSMAERRVVAADTVVRFHQAVPYRCGLVAGPRSPKPKTGVPFSPPVPSLLIAHDVCITDALIRGGRRHFLISRPSSWSIFNPHMARRPAGMSDMDFELPEELRLLKNTVRTLVDRASSSRSSYGPWMGPRRARTFAPTSSARLKKSGQRAARCSHRVSAARASVCWAWSSSGEEISRTIALPPRGPAFFGPDLRPVGLTLTPAQKEKYLFPLKLATKNTTAFAQSEPDAGS